jgi:hypothetical protein
MPLHGLGEGLRPINGNTDPNNAITLSSRDIDGLLGRVAEFLLHGDPDNIGQLREFVTGRSPSPTLTSWIGEQEVLCPTESENDAECGPRVGHHAGRRFSRSHRRGPGLRLHPARGRTDRSHVVIDVDAPIDVCRVDHIVVHPVRDTADLINNNIDICRVDHIVVHSVRDAADLINDNIDDDRPALVPNDHDHAGAVHNCSASLGGRRSAALVPTDCRAARRWECASSAACASHSQYGLAHRSCQSEAARTRDRRPVGGAGSAL